MKTISIAADRLYVGDALTKFLVTDEDESGKVYHLPAAGLNSIDHSFYLNTKSNKQLHNVLFDFVFK